MTLKGIKGASSTILHALRAGSPFKENRKNPPSQLNQLN